MIVQKQFRMPFVQKELCFIQQLTRPSGIYYLSKYRDHYTTNPNKALFFGGQIPKKEITTTILAGMKLAPPNIVQFNDPCPSRFLRSQATALIQPSTFYSTRFFRSENGVKNRLAIWEKVNKHHKIRA